MKTITRALAIMAVLSLFLSMNLRKSEAIWLHLTDEQKLEAIRFGEQSSWEAFFGTSEWVSTYGGFKAVIITPFLNLAVFAKRSAQQYKKVSIKEANKKLKNIKGTIAFTLILTDGSPDFAKDYHAVIKTAKGSVIQPIHKENPSFAKPRTLFSSIYYEATCLYIFPDKDIDPNSRITLIVISPLGREWKFPFDLSKIR